MRDESKGARKKRKLEKYCQIASCTSRFATVELGGMLLLNVGVIAEWICVCNDIKIHQYKYAPDPTIMHDHYDDGVTRRFTERYPVCVCAWLVKTALTQGVQEENDNGNRSFLYSKLPILQYKRAFTLEVKPSKTCIERFHISKRYCGKLKWESKGLLCKDNVWRPQFALCMKACSTECLLRKTQQVE